MPPRTEEKGAAEYGREALAQFREAAHYGARALAERKAAKGASEASKGIAAKVKGAATKDAPTKAASKDATSLKDRLSIPHTGSGAASELGELADATLAKFGKKGKLAAKVGVGHRIVDRLLPDQEEDDEGAEPEVEPAEAGEAPEGDDDHLFDARTPIPIQESIDVAVPVAAVFDLCTRFEELPRFSDRIAAVEVEDDTHLAVALRLAGRRQTLALEIVGEEPEERLDWEGVDGVEHSGVLTFHPLAPRLTRVELTIEQPEEGLGERLLRGLGLPERTVRRELRRFKAYAELWDEANDYRSADFKDPASQPPDEEEQEGEEAEEPPPDEDEEAEEPLEDEEVEPAPRG
ncbi:MAG TPA: SRPBCC family protein [Solirubrobacterales bacterium]|jgi:uncharacterized membrane protein